VSGEYAVWSWVWFGLVWLALLGGFLAGAAWRGYMKSLVLVIPDDDVNLTDQDVRDILRAQQNGRQSPGEVR
jgi:hypothetical protein